MAALVNYFHANLSVVWYLVGFTLLALDASLLGFSGLLLFAGLGAVTTGFFISAGILTGHEVATVATFALASAAWTAILWRFLQRLQNREQKPPKPTSDLIGYQFVLAAEMDRLKTTETRFSGIVWRVELDPEATQNHIDAGVRVRVTSLDAGVFRVMPLE